jgi:nucleoside-diphosphate-sugar epimerase
MPAKEDSLCNPKGMYSVTKRCAEQVLISFCETFGIKYRILRLCNVFGSGDKFSKKKNALQYLIQEMINGNEIGLYFNGYFKRNYMYVDDVCKAIMLCIEKSKVNDIINIGYYESYLFRELIEYSADIIGYDKNKIKAIEQPDFHKKIQVKDFSMDVEKLYGMNFMPEFIYDKLDETIKDMVKLKRI